MTIKEMEERSGLARANIRFYEAEGLFAPERKPNGYRDYSGEDLTIGFKSSFLTDILGNMTCESLVMKFADSRRAVLIVPSEEETESEKICGILMPIMIS